jgi:hypothetical protein
MVTYDGLDNETRRELSYQEQKRPAHGFGIIAKRQAQLLFDGLSKSLGPASLMRVHACARMYAHMEV